MSVYARVTRVLPWILTKIQTGECGWIKDAALRREEKNKKAKKIKRPEYEYEYAHKT